MALDSNGFDDTLSVECFVCSDKMYFSTYKPQYGHQGERLDIGECITKESISKTDHRLFCFSVENGKIAVKESFLLESDEKYHYGGFLIPTFGHYIGDTVCVCPHCYSGRMSVSLDKVLYKRRMEKINYDILSVYFFLYQDGLLLPYAENEDSGRMVARIVWAESSVRTIESTRDLIQRVRTELNACLVAFSEEKAKENNYFAMKKAMDDAYSLAENSIRLAKEQVSLCS